MPYKVTISPIVPTIKKLAVVIAVVCAMLVWLQPILAQAPFPPPRQLEVYNVQGLNFGSFYTGGTGGSVIIDVSPPSTVNYSTTGSIVAVGSQGIPAIFDVVVIPGRSINILLQASADLSHEFFPTETLTLTPGPTNRGSSFVSSGGSPFRNPVIIGGTLQVGGNSPAGNYFGTFTVTFIQE